MRIAAFDIETTNLNALMGGLLCTSFKPIAVSKEFTESSEECVPYTLRLDRCRGKDWEDDSKLVDKVVRELETYDVIVSWNGRQNPLGREWFERSYGHVAEFPHPYWKARLGRGAHLYKRRDDATRRSDRELCACADTRAASAIDPERKTPTGDGDAPPTSAPARTRSMHVALSDLSLDHLWVVYPGSREYLLDERISAAPISTVFSLAARLRG